MIFMFANEILNIFALQLSILLPEGKFLTSYGDPRKWIRKNGGDKGARRERGEQGKKMDEIKSSWLATVNSQSLRRAFLRLGL